MSRTDRWTLVLSRNDSDGAPPVEEVSALYHPSYEAAVRVAFLRRDPWRKTWQERLKERVHHLPWDEWAPWWIVEDPQVAWDQAPDGGALLWVLSRYELDYPTARYLAVGLHLLHALGDQSGLARAILAGDADAPTTRNLVATTLSTTPAEPPPRVAEVVWARRRAPLSIALALYGARERFYELSYLGRLLGAWDGPELARLVREALPREHFTAWEARAP